MDSSHCSTCGRPRGLAQQRESWSLRLPTQFVPRTDEKADKPAQVANDLICHAGIYRNGGTSDRTHLCDDCLRIGLRAIKVEIESQLSELSADFEKDKALAETSDRLAREQLRLWNICFDHNRMQERLAALLPTPEENETDSVRLARWEVSRGPVSP